MPEHGILLLITSASREDSDETAYAQTPQSLCKCIHTVVYMYNTKIGTSSWLYTSASHRIGGNRKREYIDERRSKIVRNRVFNCHLSPPDWRQMAIETLFLAIFDPHSSIAKKVFDCRLCGVSMDVYLRHLRICDKYRNLAYWPILVIMS